VWPYSLPSELVAALAVLAAASCGAAPPADPPLLTLGGQVVRRSEFVAHLRKLEARGGEPLTPAVRAALVDPFIEERLLALEARERGWVAAGASESEEQAAVKKLLEDAVLSKVDVQATEVAAYYEAHAGEFTLPERRSLSQILVASDNEARDIRRRLQRDPRSFELLARSRSRGPEASSGGRMGTFAQGELPHELEAAAFALAPGAISPVVQTPLGYHVLRVDAREPARARSLDECEAEIRNKLLQRRSEASVRQFVRALMARARVNHDAAIAAVSAG
jgi:parvulin-like peptidyl-prolyl isomerase